MSSNSRCNAIPFVFVDGVLVEGVDNVRSAVFQHFSSHYKAHTANHPSMEGLQFRSLSVCEGTALTKPFSLEEVKVAVWDCDDFKSPGPDGISFRFVKEFWDLLKSDVLRYLVEFHRNVRQILDGILVANKVVDDARKRNKELLLFKVDFDKAYDSIDWSYLDLVMVKMNFPTLWRKWIKECVGTATASVLVGSHEPVVVSHLQFADDTIILCEKSWANVRALRAILLLFEDLSGLKPLIDRINSRLSGWKSRHLSLGGRLVLLKYVLSSLPVYALSFLRLRQEVGGLGVRRIKEINLALLGKWCWRMLVEKDSLWFRVLAARNGLENGRLRVGGRDSSLWWRNVASLRSNGWFSSNISRSLGDGKDTKFWSDVWVGEVSLRARFYRLFELSLLKDESVAVMKELGWGVDGGAWRWRRRLFVWEEESVEELIILLQNVTLQVHREDQWIWKPDLSSMY
ncbi:uncharacterized protein [Medicago truncatula]|uniref:uncharacterized protein n=1 Tax=Medicago truncatula TaxID=3880 RepID=UPI000D2F428C|nr:uncharacterized protein LOC112420045 [Medicago truncatula]